MWLGDKLDIHLIMPSPDQETLNVIGMYKSIIYVVGEDANAFALVNAHYAELDCSKSLRPTISGWGQQATTDLLDGL